jgi:protein involved in polysaccharide export with SLBB domain
VKSPFAPTISSRFRSLRYGIAFLLLGAAVVARAQTPVPAGAASSDSRVAFRGEDPVIKTEVTPPTSGEAATVGEAQREMDDLAEQKQTLESEIRYAKTKLDAARRSLEGASLVGHAEEADKYEQEAKDWQVRVKSLESQLGQVNTEVQSTIQEMPSATMGNTLVVPGDNLEVFVVEDASFNGKFQVRRGGYIIMPALGRISVAGKSLAGAEDAVRTALETTQLQHATVMVEKVEGPDIETGPVVFLAGEFKNPRRFEIPPGTKATVVNIILSSGGVTDKADLTRVKVMRIIGNKSVVEEENVFNILQGINTGLGSDLTLNNGDVLNVPAGSANVIFVSGRVVRPGSIILKPGDRLSAYAAILECGGFGRFADPKKVYVLRASPDGTKVKIFVNILAIQRGRAADVPLQGNDIIIVPEKFFSF